MRKLLLLLGLLIPLSGMAWFSSWYLRGGIRQRLDEPTVGVPWSTDADGQLAATLFMRRLGLQVIPFRRPLTHLRNPGTMICVLRRSTEQDIGRSEARSILDWVSRGNTLLLYTDVNNPLLDQLGGQLFEGSQRDGQFEGWRGLSTPPMLHGARQLAVSGTHLTLNWRRGVDNQALYTRGEGVTASYLAHGEGEVLIFSSPDLISNAGLADPGNAVLLRNLARHLMAGRPVYIDEYHAGRYQQTTFWNYLQGLGLPLPLLLQILLLLCLSAWRLRLRFGRSYARRAELSRQGTEFAYALADIHWRLGHSQIVTADIRRRLIMAISQAVPGSVAPDGALRLKQLQRDPRGLPLARIRKRLEELAQADARIGPSRLVALSRRVDQLIPVILRCATRR